MILKKEIFVRDDYSFRPMTEENLPLLFGWLNEDHVKRWWDSENNYSEFETRYRANINSIDDAPFIVYFRERPFGYINYWSVESDPDFQPLFPEHAVGTDQFIGEKKLIGCGHGTLMVKYFTDWLLHNPNIPLVMTDPDVKNLAAIRCYEKAGFTFVSELETSEGKIHLMKKIL